MPIITSKTDQAIRNEFDRRRFLKLAGVGGFGVVLYSPLGATSLAMGRPISPLPAGFTDFLRNFVGFVGDIGMSALGHKMSQWLPNHPPVQNAFNGFLRGLNGYSPHSEFDMLGGYRSTFLPVYNPNSGLYMTPFFNQGNGQFGSGIKWFSGMSLPEVNNIIKREDGLDNDDRSQYLLPRRPNKNNYDNRHLPERYQTDAGSTGFDYKGDDRSGEVKYEIYTKGSSGSLEKLAKRGTLGVELER